MAPVQMERELVGEGLVLGIRRRETRLARVVVDRLLGLDPSDEAPAPPLESAASNSSLPISERPATPAFWALWYSSALLSFARDCLFMSWLLSIRGYPSILPDKPMTGGARLAVSRNG